MLDGCVERIRLPFHIEQVQKLSSIGERKPKAFFVMIESPSGR